MLKICRSPARLVFSGGSCDYKNFYEQHGAFLIGTSINKYTYVTLREYPDIFPTKYKIQYSKTEEVNDFNNIKHDGIRGTLQYFYEHAKLYGITVPNRLEILHMSDVPTRCGLAGSSSLILSLSKLIAPHIKNEELAKLTTYIERDVLKEPGGVADPIWGCGGLNSVEIKKDGQCIIRPMSVCNDFKDRLEKSIVLVYTGASKLSFQIASSHNTGKDDIKLEILKRSFEMKSAFDKEDIPEIARLVQEGWEQKRKLSPGISADGIDTLLTALTSYGSLGNRLLGSGGGGFILSIVDHPESFINKLEQNGLKYITIEFDNEGTKVL